MRIGSDGDNIWKPCRPGLVLTSMGAWLLVEQDKGGNGRVCTSRSGWGSGAIQ